jgi:hypothetical protein
MATTVVAGRSAELHGDGQSQLATQSYRTCRATGDDQVQ